MDGPRTEQVTYRALFSRQSQNLLRHRNVHLPMLSLCYQPPDGLASNKQTKLTFKLRATHFNNNTSLVSFILIWFSTKLFLSRQNYDKVTNLSAISARKLLEIINMICFSSLSWHILGNLPAFDKYNSIATISFVSIICNFSSPQMKSFVLIQTIWNKCLVKCSDTSRGWHIILKKIILGFCWFGWMTPHHLSHSRV